MSAFSQGFNFRFANGMFNNMFSGFNMPCFNFFNSNFTAVSNPCCDGFSQYSQPTSQVNMPIFNFNSGMNVNMSGFDMSNFSMPSKSVFNFDMPQCNWSIDSFVYSRNRKKDYSDSDTSSFSYDAEALMNKWKKKQPQLTQGFYNKVVEISKRVQCDPNDLMGLMDIETVGTFSPSKTNGIGAIGLIQFIPQYVSSYGTTPEALKKMSAVEQLTYVEKYLLTNKKTYGITGKLDAGTLYALVFLPARAKQDVLTRKGEDYYSSNPLLDENKDKKITKSDLATLIRQHQA